jgi:anti-sigma regulatory factor (Ser/Thr protein kinase)
VGREQPAQTLRLSIASDGDILAARSQIRAAVLELGFAATDMVRIVTAVSELARNILLYAGRGELRLELVSQGGREGVQITAQDEGPGIPDVAKALLDGFSTSGGLGLGLPGARRLMDEFQIRTEVKKGTTVTVKKWLGEGVLRLEKPAESRSPVVSGTAARTLPGESATGDRSVLRVYPGGALFAVIDGLGHGPEAAHAAGIAAGVLQGSSSTDIVGLVEECHRRLHHSRGVVMTVVALDTAQGRASWLGVGNVQGMLVHGANNRHNSSGRAFTLLRGGTVGQHLPKLAPSSFAVERGDTFVIATDGIALDFMKEHSMDQPPQLLAERILTQYGLANDDALVLVVRYVGETRGR